MIDFIKEISKNRDTNKTMIIGVQVTFSKDNYTIGKHTVRYINAEEYVPVSKKTVKEVMERLNEMAIAGGASLYTLWVIAILPNGEVDINNLELRRGGKLVSSTIHKRI